MIKTTMVFAMLLAVSFVGAGLTVDMDVPDAAPAEAEKPWYEAELLPGAPTTGPVPMGLAHLTHGNDWTVDQPPAGQSALERAEWVMNERAVQGKTPQQWIDWATGLGQAPAALPEADLDVALARLYAALDLPVDASQLLTIKTQAATLPADIEGPFAGLVDVIATAYEEQAEVAADINARFPTFDPHEPLMTHEQRDDTSARAERIMGAVATFRTLTEDLWADVPALAASNDPPLFRDPNGLVILGGTGDAVYEADGVLGDPVLLVDPSGNDVYHNSAGGACPDAGAVLVAGCNLLALSVVSDFTGDDDYVYIGEPNVVQGAGAMGGLGILIDPQGNDLYQIEMTRGGSGPRLTVQYYFDGGGQGYGYFGQGYLIDGLGDDVWDFDVDSTFNRHIWLLGQGFGGGGGVGVALDGDGNDVWDTQAIIAADGPSNGFQGVYSMGTGFYGGVGFMGDLGMDDDVYVSYVYSRTADYYAQGFGAFGGIGIMYEDGGNDDYFAGEHGRNPWISPLLNCAYGTGSYAGTGIIVDVAGNDRYYGETINDRRGATIDNEGAGHPAPAYGLFMDTGGDDEHLMYVFAPPGQTTHIGGRGVVYNDNLIGTYVDIGGTDTYVGPGGDGEVWTLGADINTV